MQIRKLLAIPLLTLPLTCGGAATAQSSVPSSDPSSHASAADQKFAQKAMQGGMAEVQLGHLAAQKASAADVKQFGQQMVQDHTKLNDQMKQLAPSLGVAPPSALDAKDQALQTKLQGLSGDDFDKAYIQAMVSDHKKDLAEFRKEVATTHNPELKDAAQQGQTVIQSHLQMVEGIAKAHHGTKTAGMSGF